MNEQIRKTKWCIVGGGMLGLALAHRIASADREVTVLEASDRFGGLADAWQIGPITWDRHYHVSLLSDRNLAALLKDIGLDRDMRWTITKTDFYTDNTFYPLNNAVDYIRFPPLGLIDKARLAFTILYAANLRNGVRLESIPVETWLTKLSGRRTYERIWRPLLRAKLGPNHKVVSASFIWSVINRFYGARRSGLKTEMFGTVKGGYASIVKHLTEDLQRRGVRTLTSSPVREISSVAGGLSVTTPHGTSTYDRVIVTTPGPHAARMCPQLQGEERGRLEALKYQGVVCASLLLKKPLRGRYLTYVADESVPFTGIIEMTAVVPPEDFGGRTLVYLPTYVPSDDPLFEASDEEIHERSLKTLSKMYKTFTPDDLIAFKVSRARNVMAIQGLNYSKSVPAQTTSVPGLFIVNSAQIINGNLNVDETIALADRAAASLLPSRSSDAIKV